MTQHRGYRTWRGRLLRSRFALAVLIVVAIFVAAAMLYCRNQLAELPELRSVNLERRDLEITVNTTGIIEPIDVVEVGTAVPGRIVSLGDTSQRPPRDVGIGSRVVEGEILAQLDQELYQIDVDKAIAAWRLADAEVKRLEIQLRQATTDLNRAQALRQTNAPAEFERVATAHAMAQAELSIGQARRDQAFAARQLAEAKIKHTAIRAPIDGIVIDQRTMQGQNVSPGSHALFLLARSVDSMQIRASVSEADIGKVRVGQKVTFTVDAYRDTPMTGRVDEILMNARIKGSFVTYDVIVKIDKPLVTLMPHMTADVEFITQKRDQAWLVPTEALRWQPSPEQVAGESITPVTAEMAAGAPNKNSGQNSQPADPTEGEAAVVWVADSTGKVTPIQVTVGVDDGVKTQVIGEGFHQDLPIVVGTVKKTTLARIIPSVKTVR